jgi:hypothetical protein
MVPTAVSYKWEHNRRAMPRKNNIIFTRRPLNNFPRLSADVSSREMDARSGEHSAKKNGGRGAKPSSPIVREHRSPKAVELYSDWLTYSSYGFISFYNLIHFGRKMKNLFLFDVDPDLLFSFYANPESLKTPNRILV